MKIKKFLKPTVLKIIIALLVGIIYLYIAGENGCGAGFGFSFCYKAYGFPFLYLVKGNTDIAFNYFKTSFLGEYFTKSGNSLFNPAALISDIILIYLLACFLNLLFKNKIKN